MVVGLALVLVYGRLTGVGKALAGIGINMIFSIPGMVMATIFVCIPLVVRAVGPVLEEIGDDQEQAANTLGAGPLQTFLRITLPSIRGALAYGVVLALARSLGEYGAVAVVSGRLVGRTQTVTLLRAGALPELRPADGVRLCRPARRHRHRGPADQPRPAPEGTHVMSIIVSNVNKSFGDFAALTDVSVEIPSGSLTALLGPSGGGKSTLLRVIAGLEEPDSGLVEIEGRDATGLPAQDRGVGFVFQHYAAFKHLSVARNVAFGLEIRKRPKAEITRKVDELLELVHLEQFAHRYPAQLSGGQRQRMALARALAVEPQVLLLDEPFGALDAQVRKELRAWLRRLHDQVHVTTVFVTHDQEEAMEVADSIVVMADGKVEQIGSPDQLYEAPANDFVMSFLGPVTKLEGELVRPHDLELSTEPRPGTVVAAVTRVTRLGFEVRVDLRVEGEELWAQVTRGSSEQLGLVEGQTLHIRRSTPVRAAAAVS